MDLWLHFPIRIHGVMLNESFESRFLGHSYHSLVTFKHASIW